MGAFWGNLGGFRGDFLDINRIKFVGYAFQIEMKYKAWIKGFNLIEESIVFLNRAHGNSKMDRSIILEAFFGVLYLRVSKRKKTGKSFWMIKYLMGICKPLNYLK